MPKPQNLSIRMIRGDLNDLPQFALPAGCGIRWYRPGDEADWLAIHRLADQHIVFTDRTFQIEFGQDVEELQRRQCYLCDAAGRAIGTTTAWYDNDYNGKVYGRVHWVAIVPPMQGRGLAKPMMTAVCNRLVELGHRRAYLTTSTLRIPAICLYLNFGFAPEIKSEDDLRAWRDVRRAMPEAKRPALRHPGL